MARCFDKDYWLVAAGLGVAFAATIEVQAQGCSYSEDYRHH